MSFLVYEIPDNIEVLEVLKAVENPDFSFMSLEIAREYNLSVHMSRNRLLYTLYWLEKQEFISRKQNVEKAQKRYFITEGGTRLLRTLEREIR
ncbi:DUF3116 family protein [Listeria booriae]|uniref:DUF3116 family protein n=1 Tax=Listeria booriae TaxID=1552123 RepID=A0A842CTP0_9LIST|nr:DUF3116 family protein [Listeria booriae]MBC2002170.1 DUF3116 family protein [Listeria booriae]